MKNVTVDMVLAECLGVHQKDLKTSVSLARHVGKHDVIILTPTELIVSGL